MNRSSGLGLGRRGRADVRPRLLPVAVAPLLLLPTRHSIAAVRLLLLPNALRTHHRAIDRMLPRCEPDDARLFSSTNLSFR